MEQVLTTLARARRAVQRAGEAAEAWKFDPANLTEAEAMGAFLASIKGAELLLDQAVRTVTSVWGSGEGVR